MAPRTVLDFEEVNSNLRNLYIKYLPNLLIMYHKLYSLTYGDVVKSEINNNRKFDDFSHPFLLYCWEEYCKSNLRVMVFGQESNAWDPNDKFYEYIENEDDLDEFIKLYKHKNNHPNNRWFPKYLVKLSEMFGYDTSNGTQVRSIVWNNMNKFGRAGDRGRAYEIVTNLENEYFNIVMQEIECVKPEACIFLTGHECDRFLHKKFDSNDEPLQFHEVEGFDINHLARVSGGNLPFHSYRTYHPGYGACFGHQENYDKIISKIVACCLEIARL